MSFAAWSEEKYSLLHVSEKANTDTQGAAGCSTGSKPVFSSPLLCKLLLRLCMCDRNSSLGDYKPLHVWEMFSCKTALSVDLVYIWYHEDEVIDKVWDKLFLWIGKIVTWRIIIFKNFGKNINPYACTSGYKRTTEQQQQRKCFWTTWGLQVFLCIFLREVL